MKLPRRRLLEGRNLIFLHFVHTIIGGIKSREDLSILRTLRENDKILNIDIKGKKIDKFLDYFPDEVSEWESKLKKPSNQ